jgi:hypothetical protein
VSTRKHDIVTGLLPTVPESIRETVDQAMISWWMNLRSQGGLRLTDHGYKIMHDVLCIESWSVDISTPKSALSKKVILAMDKKLDWPYYIAVGKKKVVFFSSKEAMMASLYGDLKTWLSVV